MVHLYLVLEVDGDVRSVITTFADISFLRADQTSAVEDEAVARGTSRDVLTGASREMTDTLSAVLLNLEYARVDLASRNGDFREVVEAWGEAQNGTEMLRQLADALLLLGRAPLRSEALDLEPLVRAALVPFAPKSPHDATVEVHCVDKAIVSADVSST